MASTINANTSGGLISSGDTSGILELQSAGTTKLIVNSTGVDLVGYVVGSPVGSNDGLYQAQQYYRLNTAVAGTNATGNQSLFGVGVPLQASTQYEFEIVCLLGKSAGITAHTISFGFGGTATLNNISYFIQTNLSTWTGSISDIDIGAGTLAQGYLNTATMTVVSPSAPANTNMYMYAVVKGTVSVNAAGTFIPQYALSAAPGGAYSTQIGSYMKISPVGAAGANINIGGWA